MPDSTAQARHTVATLVASVSDADLVAALHRLYYKGQAEQADGYLEVLAKLRAMKPEPTTMDCVLVREKSAIHVHGVEMGDPTHWAIEYVSWPHWLGMAVHLHQGLELSEADMLANILYEMTWAGFDEDEIAAQRAEIDSTVESIDGMEP